uniref:Uncharacterized protein n=1 Tax=Megaselia scalaris TaxID=36166 RepID=T1GJT0_MEGSC
MKFLRTSLKQNVQVSTTNFKESTGEIWRGHHRPSRDPMERKRGDYGHPSKHEFGVGFAVRGKARHLHKLLKNI